MKFAQKCKRLRQRELENIIDMIKNNILERSKRGEGEFELFTVIDDIIFTPYSINYDLSGKVEIVIEELKSEGFDIVREENKVIVRW